VFALNVLVAMAIVALAAPGASPFGREEARVGLLGLAAGLGISNHHSIILLAPIGLYAAIAAARRSGRPLACVALGAGALAAGLLPYAYIPYVARTTPIGTG